MSEVTIRPFKSTDANLIYSTWLRNYFHSSAFAKKISSDVFFKYHQLIVERILSRSKDHVLIACLPDAPDVIVGYLVYEKLPQDLVIHYCYVKKAFRKLGIAKSLFASAGIDLDQSNYYSHLTYEVEPIIRTYPNLIYSPYLI